MHDTRADEAATPFDSFEVAGCRSNACDTEPFVSNSEADFFTVYGKGGTHPTTAIGDFSTREDALHIAHRLAATSGAEVDARTF